MRQGSPLTTDDKTPLFILHQPIQSTSFQIRVNGSVRGFRFDSRFRELLDSLQSVFTRVFVNVLVARVRHSI